jgi:hypothetical protein
MDKGLSTPSGKTRHTCQDGTCSRDEVCSVCLSPLKDRAVTTPSRCKGEAVQTSCKVHRNALRGHHFYTNVCNGCSSVPCTAHLPCSLFKYCKAMEVGVSAVPVSAVTNTTANSVGPEQPCANKGGNCTSCQPCKKCCSVRSPLLLWQFVLAVNFYTVDDSMQIGHAAKDSYRSNCVELAAKTGSFCDLLY